MKNKILFKRILVFMIIFSLLFSYIDFSTFIVLGDNAKQEELIDNSSSDIDNESENFTNNAEIVVENNIVVEETIINHEQNYVTPIINDVDDVSSKNIDETTNIVDNIVTIVPIDNVTIEENDSNTNLNNNENNENSENDINSNPNNTNKPIYINPIINKLENQDAEEQEFIEVETIDDLSKEIVSLSENDDLDNEDLFSTKRLIVLSNSPFETENAISIVNYGNLYILSYETEKLCRQDYEILSNDETILSVEIDKVIETSTINGTLYDSNDIDTNEENILETIDEQQDESVVNNTTNNMVNEDEYYPLVAILDSGIDKNNDLFNNRYIDIEKIYLLVDKKTLYKTIMDMEHLLPPLLSKIQMPNCCQ